MSLQDRVILITGSSNGIGKACALRVAQEGARVVINYNRNASAAHAIVESLGGSDRALAVQADVSKLADVERLVTETVAKFGRIDTVMASAGLMLMREVERTSVDEFDQMFDINVKGPYFLAQKCIPHMSPGSQIIFVSTGINSSSIVTPDYTLYAATKGAIDQMTRTMSKGLAAKGITVNAIAPGPTSTDLFLNGKTEQGLEMIKHMNPFQRIGSPEEIANVVYFLCSRNSSWVNGQIIRANGGSMV